MSNGLRPMVSESRPSCGVIMMSSSAAMEPSLPSAVAVLTRLFFLATRSACGNACAMSALPSTCRNTMASRSARGTVGREGGGANGGETLPDPDASGERSALEGDRIRCFRGQCAHSFAGRRSPAHGEIVSAATPCGYLANAAQQQQDAITKMSEEGVGRMVQWEKGRDQSRAFTSHHNTI